MEFTSSSTGATGCGIGMAGGRGSRATLTPRERERERGREREGGREGGEGEGEREREGEREGRRGGREREYTPELEYIPVCASSKSKSS